MHFLIDLGAFSMHGFSGNAFMDQNSLISLVETRIATEKQDALFRMKN